MAAQDQNLFTRNYQSKIIKNDADSKCWFCGKFEETVDQLVSGYLIMTPNEYLQRHDRVGQYIHWKICQYYNAPYGRNWCKHKPQKLVETKTAIILWDFPIQTDRTIQANKPDITRKDRKEKICKLIDFTFPVDINISAEEFKKLSKYKDLQIAAETMWQLKISIISIVVGTLLLVENWTAKHFEKITGKQNLAEIQKIVLTSTAHNLRKVLLI